MGFVIPSRLYDTHNRLERGECPDKISDEICGICDIKLAVLGLTFSEANPRKISGCAPDNTEGEHKFFLSEN